MSEIVKPHSDLGASSCERWMQCPGSVGLIRQHPRPKTSVFAAEGTLAHSVAEAVVRSVIHKDPESLRKYDIGTEYTVEGHDLEVTEEMHDGAIMYLETIGHIYDTYSLHPGQVMLETKVYIPGDPGDGEDKFGTADCIIAIPYQPLYVIDYKYGKGKRVDVTDNKQLKYYALGALLAIPEFLRDTIYEVVLVIVQPRTPFGDPVTRFIIKKEDLLITFNQELNAAASKCASPEAPRVPGKHCNECFCPVQAVCPEAKYKAVEIAQKDFADIQLPAVYSAGILPRPEAMTAEQRATVLDGKKFLEAWLDAVYEYSLALEESNPGSTPGYKLVAKRAHRKWLPEAEAALVEQYGDGVYRPVEVKLKTPAQLEKAIGKSAKPTIAKYCETPFTGSNLVPLSDRREEVQKIPGSEFEGVIIDV